MRFAYLTSVPGDDASSPKSITIRRSTPGDQRKSTQRENEETWTEDTTVSLAPATVTSRSQCRFDPVR